MSDDNKCAYASSFPPSQKRLIRVIIESPYAGDVRKNVAYARECLRDSLTRGEAPIASHLLYTQPGVLKDKNKEERELGINAGLAWLEVAEKHIFYTDLGLSPGMLYAVRKAQERGTPIEYRNIRETKNETPNPA